MSSSPTPYSDLTPDCILDALEGAGLRPDGRLLALNSYENRVYQVGIEDATPVVVKFYRPGRWSDAAILEEHAFAFELAEREIPVVAPVVDADGISLHRHAEHRFAVYPRRGGRWPELDDPEVQFRLGQFIGRLHAVGEVRPFVHRPTLDVTSFGHEPARRLLDSGVIPASHRENYRLLTGQLLARIETAFAQAGDVRILRLHGDCHPGNLLWTEGGAHIVDLDDARMGPAMQDLWMLLSGEPAEMGRQLDELLAGYEEFRDFDRRELALIEPLRTLRMIHYAAWLAARWDDPAFPQAFPWFDSPRYWDDHILALREQQWRLDEPPPRVSA
ncbi:MAG: serine/threonine protein kinase [Chromatiales bacterium]|nr:serine/threonine protein kinase [Chromatiales bacterium]MDX9767468.1 serine/threonine protein kinase [Ectothiorhodospiraceae bacterium]